MIKTHHLEILYQYVMFCVKTKKVRPTFFHKKYKPYSRKQSTYDLLKKGASKMIFFQPRLLCLPDIEVKFVEFKGVPRIDLYREKREDPNVTYVLTLMGAFSLIYFEHGKRTLKYVDCITPSYPGTLTFDEIDPTHKKGMLEEMPKPLDWDDLDWAVYESRKDPRRSSVTVGNELGVSYKTVLNRFNEILKDCKIWIPFFPNGYTNYTKYVLTLKTDYELGLINELRKLDRSSYVYKADDTLILTLFFDRELEVESFLKMEKKGIIHDLRVSFPVQFSNVFEDFWKG